MGFELKKNYLTHDIHFSHCGGFFSVDVSLSLGFPNVFDKMPHNSTFTHTLRLSQKQIKSNDRMSGILHTKHIALDSLPYSDGNSWEH